MCRVRRMERAFIDAMIPHHQSATDAQQREIDEMTAWREEWYPEG